MPILCCASETWIVFRKMEVALGAFTENTLKNIQYVPVEENVR